VRVLLADGHLAKRQATWIVALEPWLSLGYEDLRLGQWLATAGRLGRVLVVASGARVVGIIVVQPEFLLGTFIALLAVRPEAAGQGVGRKLVEHVARRTFARRRWLYVSSDTANRAAGNFYKKLGFQRVGKLPDLVRPGRTEILWRRARPGR
jgi:ribosomal protein S18 acetylase RimI-like enzyme